MEEEVVDEKNNEHGEPMSFRLPLSSHAAKTALLYANLQLNFIPSVYTNWGEQQSLFI